MSIDFNLLECLSEGIFVKFSQVRTSPLYKYREKAYKYFHTSPGRNCLNKSKEEEKKNEKNINTKR